MTPPETAPLAYRHEGGQPVFTEAWHAQAIAVVELLVASGRISAGHWAETLGAELARRSGEPDTEDSYYAAFLGALETVTDTSSLAPVTDVDARETDWRDAYLNTPHGQPVFLRK